MSHDDECDYCGQRGCQWQRHPEAHGDVIRWERTYTAQDNQ